MSTILVTGGTGYIGSHTVVELLAAGHGVVIVDNLCNSRADVVERVGRIAGRLPDFVQADLRDPDAMQALFRAHRFDTVLHFAGLKAVGESVAKPLEYYDNNVAGTLVLAGAMAAAGVKRLVFSSSATVYGDPHSVPIREDFPLSATNPYGRSKLMIEDMLRDLARSDPAWRIALLRYFNPVGAHPSGLIGEEPAGIPNNLMPYVAQVAMGKRARLQVFGGDYPTPDGTGIRDYIHVVDLAAGHVAALAAIDRAPGAVGSTPGAMGSTLGAMGSTLDVLTLNLGTGRGYSVLEVVRAFAAASGRPVPYDITARRPGDIACCYADPGLALQILGWQAQRGLPDMCADAWRWQSMQMPSE